MNNDSNYQTYFESLTKGAYFILFNYSFRFYALLCTILLSVSYL